MVDGSIYIFDRRKREMEYIRQTIDSFKLYDIFAIPQSLRDKMVDVIILPAENIAEVEPKREIKFGFIRDKVPPLPDSFFDPLPEEDLQLWGL
jgi:hypothetical protein